MGNSSSSELPLAGVICLAVFGYTSLIFIIVLIRYICMRQGKCQNVECGLCGKEGAPQCSQCCISCSEASGCTAPSVTGCLDKCCPNKKLTCVDVLLCQCCLGENNCFTKSSGSCDSCYCNFSCPQCEAVSCCCIEIKLRQPSLTSFTQQPTSSDPSKTTIRNTFSPSGNVMAQEKLFQASNASGIVTSQMHINRAFDETVEKVTEMQTQDECPRKSKLKPISSRNAVSKVVVHDNDEPGSIEVKGKRIRDRKKLSNEKDKVVPFKENPEKEVPPRKKPRKKRTKPSPDQIGESTSVEPLPGRGRKVPCPKNTSKAQLLPLSSIKSSSTTPSTGNRNPKKVTWRNQPMKPVD